MGELLRTFNYPRNAFASSPQESADKVHEVLGRTRRNALLEKDEPFNDSKTFLGIVRREGDDVMVTRVGSAYEELYVENPVGAWRWLVTRAMWRYSLPNGTQSRSNRVAQESGASFNFFDLVTRLTWVVGSEPWPRDVLYFDELFALLEDDDAWSLDYRSLARALWERRPDDDSFPGPSERRSLLGDLEEEYGCGRDNMNTIFRKAFGQSGLFELIEHSRFVVGIRISPKVPNDSVLWERLRYLLDNPVRWSAD